MDGFPELLGPHGKLLPQLGGPLSRVGAYLAQHCVVDCIGLWGVDELSFQPLPPLEQRTRIDWPEPRNGKHLALIDIGSRLYAVGGQCCFLRMADPTDLDVPNAKALQIVSQLTRTTIGLILRDLFPLFGRSCGGALG